MKARHYINEADKPYKNIEDFNEIKSGDFYYYECNTCHTVKERRFYNIEQVEFICRECKFKQTSVDKYGGQNPGYVKMQQKMLEKYGSRSTAQFIDYSKIDYKQNAAKSKQTCLEKYGVDNPAKADEVKEKIKNTCLEKYGFESALQSEEVKEKIKQSIINKYGSFKNAPGPQASKKKFVDMRKEEADSLDLIWLDQDKFNGKYDNGPIYYHFKCKKCGREFEDDFHSGKPVCKVCNAPDMSSSRAEKEIAEYVKSIYNKTILLNDRTALSGKELDIYLPDIQVAIEYNGTYWHGYRADTTMSLADFKRKTEEKRKSCNDLGIRLITIDEADYNLRPEVFKRFVSDTILPRTRIFARNCEIRKIDTKTAREFCEYYHVDGYRNGSEKYGIYYNNELLIVAVFAAHKAYGHECIRLCFKSGYDVIGGWAKIQKHFGRQFLHYVNLKYFDGLNKTGLGYRFWLKHRLIDRRQLQKKDLANYFTNIDENISAFQNCINNGAIAIFDLGNDIRVYNSNQSN